MRSAQNSAQTISHFAQTETQANAQHAHAGKYDMWGIPTRDGLEGNVPSWECEGMDSLKNATRQRVCLRQRDFFSRVLYFALEVCIYRNVIYSLSILTLVCNYCFIVLTFILHTCHLRNWTIFPAIILIVGYSMKLSSSLLRIWRSTPIILSICHSALLPSFDILSHSYLPHR